MILVGFDAGKKKTGIAIGNLHSGTARPLGIVYGSSEAQLQSIQHYITTWQPESAVVGLPAAHADGSVHRMARFCQYFAAMLQQQFNLPVNFVDEALTSVTARGLKKGKVDDVAAAIILQSYIYNLQNQVTTSA